MNWMKILNDEEVKLSDGEYVLGVLMQERCSQPAGPRQAPSTDRRLIDYLNSCTNTTEQKVNSTFYS